MRWLIGNWRPRLSAVVLGILLTVLTLPLVGLFFFRLYENTLIRQTEAELIAQGAALSALYAGEIRDAGVPDVKMGPRVARGGWSQYQGARKFGSEPKEPVGEPLEDISASRSINPMQDYGRFTPIEPTLDLALDAVLPPRPAPLPGIADPLYMGIGSKLTPLLMDTQKITLAGFKLLDPQGVVVAGTQEIGLSLAHVPEVAAALIGRFASVLRQRVSDQAPPALYSISRGAKVRVFVALPVLVNQRVAGVVYLSRTPNNVVKHLYSERGKVALAGFAMLAATFLIGYVFIRLISRPMAELLDRTRRLADGEANALKPLSHHGTREMAVLAGGFLDMARKLQARSDTLKTFATHVSHELKSPLTSIQGAAELLRDNGEDMSPEKRHRFENNIVEDTERLKALVRRLIELARAENAVSGKETTTLSAALRQIVPPAKLSVGAVGAANDPVAISDENLAIILSNLAENSANHGATMLALSSEWRGKKVLLVAHDDGEGVPEADRAKIFEPFYTTRRDAGGTGLGLGIVTAVLKTHNGEIRLAESARGARFEIELPAA